MSAKIYPWNEPEEMSLVGFNKSTSELENQLGSPLLDIRARTQNTINRK
jgi:hypothetical protein